jgi:DNA (cytosine-5)-methyltransferase 1
MSPDCTHFSKAKGSKPVSKRVRGLAWVGKRWAATVRPRIIFLENVEEFQTWGPLVRINGDLHPCKKRAGRTFRSFVRELQRLGYAVEWQTMRACDYGAPTIRKRLFLVARCDGELISWPNASHAEPKVAAVSGLAPWRTAAECIDWSIPCPSIFTRKKALAENTLRRIARGIQRYVIDSPEPFIIPIAHYNGSTPAHSIRKPLRTVTANPKGGAFAVVAPSLSTYYGAKGGNHHRGQPLTDPLRTQTTENRFALQSAMLLKHYGGVVGTSLDVPAGTITTADHHAIGAATLIQTGYGERPGQAPRALHLNKPIGTMMAGGVKHAVAAAHMVRHFGESVGSAVTDPVGTVTAGGMGKTGLATATLIRNFGGSNAVDIEAPHPTVVSKQKDSLVAAQLVGCGGRADQSRPRDVDEPLHTITSKADTCIAASNLVKLRGSCKDGQRTTEPMPTVTAGGMHVAEVRAFLTQYYGCSEERGLRDPLNTVTTKDRFGLVTVKGELFQIVDIGMRMLAPRELYRAQGFPDDYIIDHVIDDGKRVPLTITDQVRFCGNSVSPYNAAALVAANNRTVRRAVAA